MLVALNKIDIPEALEKIPALEKTLRERGYAPIAISAATGENVRPVLWKLHEMLLAVPEEAEPEALPLYVPKEDPRKFEISRDEDGDWVVRGVSIERAAKMTYWEHSGSVRRFQNLLTTLGIEDALRRAGVENGDTVMIGDDFELEWFD